MRPITPRNWLEEDFTAQLVDEATPPALVSLLAEAESWPVDVAVTPYAGCAHIFDGLSAAAYEDRYLAAIIAPGAVHGRAGITRAYLTTVGSGYPWHEMYSSVGGTTGNDVIHVPWHLVESLNYLPDFSFQYAQHNITVSGESIVDSPSRNLDRQIELQTNSAPYVEPLYISKAAGFSLVISEQIDDLESL